MFRTIVTTSVFVVLTNAAQAQEFEGTAQPADVLVGVTEFAQDLDAVRAYMGKPIGNSDRFRSEYAAPRHVYYQAQIMFRKANRLGMQLAGGARRAPPPAPEDLMILPEDVLRVVQLAQAELELIREAIGIEIDVPAPARNARAQPTDVFEEIVAVNRQLNQMVAIPYGPPDANEQMVLASTFLAQVLAAAGREPRPDVEFVPNGTPIDVYNRLIECLVLNHEIGETLGIETLEIIARNVRRDRSSAADNYDIATMLMSDIAYWTDALDRNASYSPDPETLRHIFPAHVLRSATILRNQLEQMLTLL